MGANLDPVGVRHCAGRGRSFGGTVPCRIADIRKEIASLSLRKKTCRETSVCYPYAFRLWGGSGSQYVAIRRNTARGGRGVFGEGLSGNEQLVPAVYASVCGRSVGPDSAEKG